MSTTVPCLICRRENERFQVFERRALFTKPLVTPQPDAVGDMSVAYCPSCRHISSRFETVVNLEAAREVVYRELYEHYGATGLSPAQERWTDFVVARLVHVLPPESRVLEIGSHDGYVLHRLSKHGHECVGVEPSPHGERSKASYGVDVRSEFFRPGLFDEETFDAVVVRHVAEHVEEPAQFLTDIVRTLRPGGLAYVEVPDSHGSVEEAFFPEFHADHISYFTPPSAQLVLELAGCNEILHVESSRAYMRFPFISAFARRAPASDATPSPVPGAWFQDFGMDSLLRSFGEKHATYLANLRSLQDRGRIAVWGTGSIGTQYAIDAGWGDEVTYVDLSEATHGLRLSVTGQVIQPPSVLREGAFDVLLIASGWEKDALRQAEEWASPSTALLTFSNLLSGAA